MFQTIILLFVVYGMNNGQNLPALQVELSPITQTIYRGVFGQACPIPETDVICLNKAPSFGGSASEIYPGIPGFTKCERKGDCCGCSLIVCGNLLVGCNTLSVGDYGVFGVQNINILGRSEDLGGGNILCFGIEGCAESVIVASNIKNIEGSTAGSLRNARVTVTKPVAGFRLDCVAIGSCENANFELNIDALAPPEGMKCNPAYDAATIQFGSISCYGQNSCKNMHFTINNMGCNRVEIQRIGCYTDTACVGATFHFSGNIAVNSCHLIGQSDGVAQGLSNICGLGVGPYTAGEYVHVPYPAQSPQVRHAVAGPPYYHRPPHWNA